MIYPPVTVLGRGKVSPHYPMGLLYVASYLESVGHEVKIVDALAQGANSVKRVSGGRTRTGLSEKKIGKIIDDFKPDMVGISVMFTAFVNDAYEVARIVKKINKKICIMAGGAHVSIRPEDIVRNGLIDFAVQGEGEYVAAELCRAIEKQRDLNTVAGIVFKKDRKIIKTKRASLIKDLDTLPFPPIHKLKLVDYDAKNNAFQMRHYLVPIVTSRGCPNHCLYCSIHAVWEHSWRGRSAENVVAEIEYLMRLGVKEVCFQDDSMSVDKVRMNKICDEIIRKQIDIKWTTPNGIAHWTLDKPLIAKMKKAGCYRITFGIESGNPEIRRWVGKPFSLDQAKELTQYANKIGMWTLATNIIGFPYESRQDIEDTIVYSIESDVDFALFFRLGPRPGTPIYEIFKKEGWLPKDKQILFSEEVACETKYFKGSELFEIQHEAYSRFLRKRMLSFLNPLRIMKKIHNFEDFVYVSKIILAGVTMARTRAG